MAGFRLDVFKGIRPRVSPRLLPSGEAQTAENLRLGSGSLEPWNMPEQIEETCTSHPETIYRMRNGGNPLWLTWTDDIDVARGPVPDDALERTYYTGEDEPRMTYTTIVDGESCLPDDYRVLGVPAPTGAPSVLGDALPDTSVSGSMTIGSWVSNYLNADFVIEDNLPDNAHNNYWQMSDGSGYESTGVTREYAMDFYVGQEIRVSAVVDANNVRLEDANGQPYLAKTVQQARATGGLLHFRTDDTGTTRDGYFRFYVPNDIKVTLPAHNLLVGDIIRISSIGATVTLVLEQFSGTGTFYGEESDHPSAPAAIKTWASAPVSVAADDFWIAGARAYPFEEVWVDNTGAGSSSSFNIEGGFSWELHMRDGVLYEDIATDIESRAYVYTFVTNLGEEGAPSPASDVVTIPTDGEVVVGDFDTVPTVLADQIEVTAIRIYRTNTGSGSTEFQFVAEIATPYSDYTDSITDSELGEVLQTEDWDMPSEDMVGITALPNGIMAGFFGKTLCFSEPYYPHAWPTKYRQAVDHDIVGLGVLPNGVAVLTNGSAYIAVGDHPAAASLRHLAKSQSCTSKRSIVSTMDSVIYASPDGLASIGAGGFQLVTENHATKREWQDSFAPTEIRGFFHDGKYIGFMLEGGFIFDHTDESIGFTTLDTVIEAGYLDAEEDDLFIVLREEETPLFVAITGDVDSNTTQAMTSNDGITWTLRTTGTEKAWAGISYSPTLLGFLAFTGATTDGIMTSEDGETWTHVAHVPSDGVFVGYNAIEVGGTWFVTGSSTNFAPGLNSDVMYSSDNGVTWTHPVLSTDSTLRTVTYSASLGKWVGFSNSQTLWYSTNGIAWNAGVDPGFRPTDTTGLIWAEELGLFVAVGTPGIYTSPDGITWTSRTTPSGINNCVVWAPELGLLVAGGQGTNHIATSPNGVTWTARTCSLVVKQIAWSPELSLLVAVAVSAAAQVVATSPDGIAWTLRDTPGDGFDWDGIVYGPSRSSRFIYRWDGDEANQMTMDWYSGRTICPYPLNLGAARIEAESYPVTFKLYNDRGTLVTTRTVTSNEVFRLPGGYLTNWFEIEISGTKVVRMVHVAETAQELFQG